MVTSLVPQASAGCLDLAKSLKTAPPRPLGCSVHLLGLAGQRPPEQVGTEATSPWLSFRKTMLNDLLRFDVKDCSWCRWVASRAPGPLSFS